VQAVIQKSKMIGIEKFLIDQLRLDIRFSFIVFALIFDLSSLVLPYEGKQEVYHRFGREKTIGINLNSSTLYKYKAHEDRWNFIKY